MRRNRRWKRWLLDIAIALVVCFASITVHQPRRGGPLVEAGQSQLELLPVGYMLVMILASVALVFRKVRPLVVWAITVACGLAVTIGFGFNLTVALPTAVALYTVGTTSRRPTTAVTTVFTAIAFYTASVVVESTDWPSERMLGVIAWSIMAAALGAAVQARRAERAAERARLAEMALNREQETQRRITDERVHIARELHDVVGHNIAVVNVQAGLAERLLKTDPESSRAALAAVRSAAQSTLHDMGAIIGLLRTGTDSEDVAEPSPSLDAVPALLETMREGGLVVNAEVSRTTEHRDSVAELTAFRIVQESLTNALKHGTGSANVVLVADESGIRLEVSNTFDSDTIFDDGHGLAGMRERVDSLRGTIFTGRRKGRFVVEARLPFASGRTAR